MMKSELSLNGFLPPFSRCCVTLCYFFSFALDYTAILQFRLIQIIFSSPKVREHFNAISDVFLKYLKNISRKLKNSVSTSFFNNT